MLFRQVDAERKCDVYHHYPKKPAPMLLEHPLSFDLYLFEPLLGLIERRPVVEDIWGIEVVKRVPGLPNFERKPGLGAMEVFVRAGFDGAEGPSRRDPSTIFDDEGRCTEFREWWHSDEPILERPPTV